MQIGVFIALYRNLSFEAALDRAAAAGVTAVEIGSGSFPDSPHCPVAALLESEDAREAYWQAVRSRGLTISAFSCHNNPIHPDPEVAERDDMVLRKNIQLANKMGVPVVVTFSGLPGGAPGDRTPNWVTCPWPTIFSEVLDYQWNEVAIPYWREINQYAADHGIKIALEMHPGFLVYNVHTMLRLREAAGPQIGCNFDPSHLFWNGVDPVAAIRRLGEAIFHVHGKDTYVDPYNTAVNGCMDHKPYRGVAERSWGFRTIGYGHDTKVWKDIMSALRLIGYDYVVSIEHEDPLMTSDEGLAKAIDALKQAYIVDQPGDMFWV
ncbi:MAG: sugar phosphate isomerase/epimerase [Chloroflexi bacterium]|nr:sugar phosphate isomerase/epimerase [Chloroflexota bacterium]